MTGDFSVSVATSPACPAGTSVRLQQVEAVTDAGMAVADYFFPYHCVQPSEAGLTGNRRSSHMAEADLSRESNI